jgi:hypothetical protein
MSASGGLWIVAVLMPGVANGRPILDFAGRGAGPRVPRTSQPRSGASRLAERDSGVPGPARSLTSTRTMPSPAMVAVGALAGLLLLNQDLSLLQWLGITAVALEAARHLLAGPELAVREVNDADGIAGRPLELVIRDTAADPQTAAVATGNRKCAANVQPRAHLLHISCWRARGCAF